MKLPPKLHETPEHLQSAMLAVMTDFHQRHRRNRAGRRNVSLARRRRWIRIEVTEVRRLVSRKPVPTDSQLAFRFAHMALHAQASAIGNRRSAIPN